MGLFAVVVVDHPPISPTVDQYYVATSTPLFNRDVAKVSRGVVSNFKRVDPLQNPLWYRSHSIPDGSVHLSIDHYQKQNLTNLCFGASTVAMWLRTFGPSQTSFTCCTCFTAQCPALIEQFATFRFLSYERKN